MYDFHSPKQKTAIGSQETEPRPSNIIRIDQNLLSIIYDYDGNLWFVTGGFRIYPARNPAGFIGYL